MKRAAAFLAGLALAAAPAAAQDAPTQGRIWKGTLGDQAITACFVEGSDSDGIYYSDKALVPVRLSAPDDTPAPAGDQAVWQEEGSEASWTLRRAADGALAGERRKGEEMLPIRLDQVTIDVPAFSTPCEVPAFIEPLLAGGTYTTTEATFEGTPYKAVAYKGPERIGLDDYQIETFVITPASPEDEAINAMLAAELPDESADNRMGECVGWTFASGAPGGYIEDTTVPLLIGTRWVSIRQSGSEYCGGAHPNNYSTFAVYDRSTGAQADPSKWFKPGALEFYEFPPEPGQIPPIAGLSAGLMKAILARWPKDADNSECADVVGSGEGWVIGLTREGPVFVPQLPHVIFACTEEVVVPWKQARPFLSAEGRAVEASLR